MKRILTSTVLGLSLGLWGVSVYAQDFEKGLEAARQDDFATALQEWLPLAEQGDPRSQVQLGLMYANGVGVTQDDREAVKWYRLASERGDAYAHFCMGVMYEYGRGVTQDYVYAYMGFNIAAANGYKNAKNHRDALVEKLSAEDISHAQKVARICVKNNYKGCYDY